MHHRDFLCLYTDRYKRKIKACICGTTIEIEGVIKKLIHCSKKKDQEIFWRVV